MQKPIGAYWVYTVSTPYRWSSGPRVVYDWNDRSFEEVLAEAKSKVVKSNGEDRVDVTIGWLMPVTVDD